MNEKQRRSWEKLSRITKNNKEINRISFLKKSKKKILKNFWVFLRISYNRKNLNNVQWLIHLWFNYFNTKFLQKLFFIILCLKLLSVHQLLWSWTLTLDQVHEKSLTLRVQLVLKSQWVWIWAMIWVQQIHWCWI